MVAPTAQAREARRSFLVTLGDALRPLDDPQAIGTETARLLGGFVGAQRVGLAADRGDGQAFTVTGQHICGVPGIEGLHRYADFGPALLPTLQAGRTVVQHDIAGDPTLTAAQKACHAQLGIGAAVYVPLLTGARLMALLFVHTRSARAWQAEELALFEEVAERVRADLERARDMAEMKRIRTELEASHAGLRRLIAAQDSVQEQERLRIARELHDDLQQNLAAILMEAEVVRSNAGGLDERAREALARIERMDMDVMASMRRIVQDLRPQALEDLGLVPALEVLAARFAQRTGIDCQVGTSALRAADRARLTPAATCLYRVVQEALNNVARHSGARRVHVQLSSRPGGGVVLTVGDDGSGIRPEDVADPDSFGLVGMRERLIVCGGTLAVRGTPGRGTTIEATLPWPRTRPRAWTGVGGRRKAA